MSEEKLLNNVNLDHLFEAFFNSKISGKKLISPHGSNRMIVRLSSDDGHSAIGIYNKNIFENKAFVDFTNHFESYRLNVPKIYGISTDLTSYIVQDLGDTTLFTYLKSHPDSDSTVKKFYYNALENLIKFQTEAGLSVDFNLCYQFTKFGKENIEYDIDYFCERFLNEFHDKKNFDKSLDDELNDLKTELLKFPPDYFLYRDFQSRNIMIYHDELYFIDYQSGRRGALQYDLASLLYDAKANLSNNFREELLKKYIELLPTEIKINKDIFTESFWYFALIRILQALGAYGFLSRVRGKHQFLQSIPYAQKNLNYLVCEKFNNSKFTYINELVSGIKYEST